MLLLIKMKNSASYVWYASLTLCNNKLNAVIFVGVTADCKTENDCRTHCHMSTGPT